MNFLLISFWYLSKLLQIAVIYLNNNRFCWRGRGWGNNFHPGFSNWPYKSQLPDKISPQVSHGPNLECIKYSFYWTAKTSCRIKFSRNFWRNYLKIQIKISDKVFRGFSVIPNFTGHRLDFLQTQSS